MHLFGTRFPRVAAGLCLLSALGAAQGSNVCGNPQPIAGLGPHAFDTTGATTDGKAELIKPFSTGQIYNDVWFSWVAPATSAYEVETCGQTSLTTAIAVYDYGCTGIVGRAQTARSNTCGDQTILTIGTVAGRTYLIRIGSTTSYSTGAGTFILTETGLPASMGCAVYAANGRTYHILEPSSWKVAQAAAIHLNGNLVTVDDAAENDFLQQTFWYWGSQPRSFWIGYTDEEVEGVWRWVSGEITGYENWSSDNNPPNNWLKCEHYAHFRHDWNDGTWNDTYGDPYPSHLYNLVHGLVEVDGYDEGTYCPGDGSGTPCPCGNIHDGSLPGAGCANGQYTSGALLTATGTASLTNDTLVLIGEHTENYQSGLYFQANNDLSPGLIWGDGLQCAGGQLKRLGVRFSDGDGYSDTSGWTTPISVKAGNISAGDTKHYQLWYRNPLASPCGTEFNASNGYKVLWLL